MKTLLILIVTIGILGFWYMRARTPSASSSNLIVYTDPAGKFIFEYPKEFNIDNGVVRVPKDYEPQTNFERIIESFKLI